MIEQFLRWAEHKIFLLRLKISEPRFKELINEFCKLFTLASQEAHKAKDDKRCLALVSIFDEAMEDKLGMPPDLNKF